MDRKKAARDERRDELVDARELFVDLVAGRRERSDERERGRRRQRLGRGLGLFARAGEIPGLETRAGEREPSAHEADRVAFANGGDARTRDGGDGATARRRASKATRPCA